jgi:hypothetical protein
VVRPPPSVGSTSAFSAWPGPAATPPTTPCAWECIRSSPTA